MCLNALLRLCFISMLLLTLNQCASYTDDVKELREDYVRGQYASSLQKLEESSLKGRTRDRLLYQMEKAMILDRMDKRKESRTTLMNAARIVDELYTVSISKTAATFIVNESMSDYEGEDYEKVAIHTLLALSFIEDQDWKAVRVEAKKINNKLHEITQNYDPKHVHYKEDAFARFLSGLAYEKLENWDDAIIDYKKSLEIYESPDYSKFYDGRVPAAVVNSLYSVASKRGRSSLVNELRSRYPEITSAYAQRMQEVPNGADLVVVHEAGHIARKVAKDFFFPVGGQLNRISFPYIDQKNLDSWNRQSGLSIDHRYEPAANAVNLNALAYQCLEDRRARYIVKSIARLAAKGILTQQAHENFGVVGGLVANIGAVITETADTRSWNLLPQAFFINRVRVSAGKHDLEIKTSNRTTELLKVEAKSGDLLIFRSKV